MTERAKNFLCSAWTSLGGDPAAIERVHFVGEGAFPSRFAVTDFAAAAIAAAGLAASELIGEAGAVTVDRRLASFWFDFTLRPIGWRPQGPWDPLAGDYAARDGWIRLHTNAPHHRAAALKVLGCAAEREAIARSVASWEKNELESAVVEAGGCAAELRSEADWAKHPQGIAIAAEPLVAIQARESVRNSGWSPTSGRPLRGLRVLDLTRVLAGPVGSRFLAGLGAQVLRIDPPGWDEPGVVPEVTLGKRCAHLDLRQPADLACFEALLIKADILLHGYRPGALERLGYDGETLRRFAPGLVEIRHDAYGWSGPWAGRRGFDSLVQMSTGIAYAGEDKPKPLPVQALDQAVGYLIAAAALSGWARRRHSGQASLSRLSLARTALWLTQGGRAEPEEPLARESETDRSSTIENTSWGEARRLVVPLRIEGAPLHWDLPACALGGDLAVW
jgi:hypothetical protein